jgi:hypothetical protein
MEDRGNKNIICSVLFLDIVEYSKKTVTGQISLKERFNTYLSEAICDVPANDRIILDTGDGAAVNFLGDIEAALKAALSLRTSLLNEGPYVEPELLVRIGINLGPVRLVRDINGQPNIVGDGINVAQRIMAFADPSQILVSRSYFDAVSHISAQYTGMFHYQGSRTDKHVREHEIYAIGYPGDQTTRKMAALPQESPGVTARMLGGVKSFFSKPADKAEAVPEQSGTSRRNLYLALISVPVVLLMAMFFLPKKKVEDQSVAPVEIMHAADAPVAETTVQTKPAADKSASASAADKSTSGVDKSTNKVEVASAKAVPEKATPKPVQSKLPVVAQAKHKSEPGVKGDAVPVEAVSTPEKATEPVVKKSVAPNPFLPDFPMAGTEIKEGFVSITCKEEVHVFIDGIPKGKVTSGVLTVTAKPGKHKLIITHAKFGSYSEEVDTESGKTDHIKPKLCN